MAIKTPFSQEDFKPILSHYDLGTFTDSAPVTQGTVQTNFFLYTTRGKFLFRYYECRSKEAVLFETHLLTYLKEQSYPSPAPLPNVDSSCVGIYDGKPYVIFEFIQGETIEDPKYHHKQQLIQYVANLQNLTKEYQSPYTAFRWYYDPSLCRTLARKEAIKYKTRDSREKLYWMGNQIDLLNLPDSLPKGICQRDFHISNVLY